MKNNKVLGIIALVAVLGVLGFIFKDKILNKNVKEIPSETKTSKTLKELLGMGIAQKCTYDGGTIYITGSKFRGDFESVSEEKTIKSHMIVDSNVSYVWTEGSTTGIKMEFNPSETVDGQEGTTENTQNTPLDPTTPLNYSCSNWIVDGSYFELPTDVTFSDMSELLAPNASPNSQCSYCNMLTGEDKDSCLSSLNCE